MNKLIIVKSKHLGPCFGIQRAQCMVFQKKNIGPMLIMGKLAHNREVICLSQRRGVKEIKSFKNLSKGTVVFAPHGAKPKDYIQAKKKNLKIIDTTCPQVMKVQRIVKDCLDQGQEIIIFGDKKHKEVENINAWARNRAIVINSLRDSVQIKLNKDKTYGLVSQTTKVADEYDRISKILKKRLGSRCVVYMTICPIVERRQDEAIRLSKKNDLVIVVGSKKSSNSKSLYKVASIQSRCYLVEDEKDLDERWFQDVKRVAIVSGTSTPETTIRRVIKEIQKW